MGRKGNVRGGLCSSQRRLSLLKRGLETERNTPSWGLFSRLRGRMLKATRTNRCLRFAFSFPALLAGCVAFATLPAHAQGTHLWTQSRLEEFEKGTPQGVSLSSDGHLREAPALKETLTTPSTFV